MIMTTIEILNETIKLTKTKFDTFDDFINEVEDFKLGKIIKKNSWVSFDVNLLEKKYLW